MNQSLSDSVRSVAPGDAEAGGRAGRVALTMRKAPDGRSFIVRQHATYPFHICRPNYVAGDPAGMATLYLQSIAGGLFEHDRLAMEVAVEQGAALHLTSQGATIVHAMTGGQAVFTTRLSADPDTIVEILPEATILFPGAHLELQTEICADESAVVCVGESVIAHDPHRNGTTFDGFVSDMRFQTPDGRILAHDRQAADGDAFQAMSVGASNQFNTYGSVHLWAPHRDLETLRIRLAGELPGLKHTYAGVARLPNDCGLTVRILAADGAALLAARSSVWHAIRREIFSTAAPRRRK